MLSNTVRRRQEKNQEKLCYDGHKDPYAPALDIKIPAGASAPEAPMGDGTARAPSGDVMGLAADGGRRRQPERRTRPEANKTPDAPRRPPEGTPRTGDGRRWRAVRGHDVKDQNTDADPYGFPRH